MASENIVIYWGAWYYAAVLPLLGIAAAGVFSLINKFHRCQFQICGGPAQSTCCGHAYAPLPRNKTFQAKRCDHVAKEFFRAASEPPFQATIAGQKPDQLQWDALFRTCRFCLIKPRFGMRAVAWAAVDDDPELRSSVLVLAVEPCVLAFLAFPILRWCGLVAVRHELVHAAQQHWSETLRRAWRLSHSATRHRKYIHALPVSSFCNFWLCLIGLGRVWWANLRLGSADKTRRFGSQVRPPSELYRSPLILYLLTVFAYFDLWSDAEFEAHLRSGSWYLLLGFVAICFGPLTAMVISSPSWAVQFGIPVGVLCSLTLLSASFVRKSIRRTLFGNSR